MVIDKYFLLLFEYLHIMKSSAYMESSANTNPNPNLVQVGWNATTHVFKIAILRLKNVEDAFVKSQKAMYCYLEYIEQISKQTFLAIEPLEAVVFVYDKVLAPITEATAVSPTVGAIGATELSSSLKTAEKMDILANLLIPFEQQEWTLNDKIRIVEEEFYKYAILFLGDTSFQLDVLFPYIEMSKSIIQEVNQIQPFNQESWQYFLDAFYKHTKRAIQQKTVPMKKQVDEKCFILKTTMDYSSNTNTNTKLEEISKLCFI